MTIEWYAERREKLRSLMREQDIDALFISHDANRYYLSGFELKDPQKNESSGYLLICADGNDWLCTDARYKDAAARLWNTERIFIYSGNAAEQINRLIAKELRGTLGFEARSLSVAAFEKLSANLPADLTLNPADGLVEKLRMIKDSREIAALRESCALNHRLMEWIPSVLAPGRTEIEIAWDIERFFRENGASGLAFESIVAIGPNAALPHAIPGTDILTENCPILIDVGCRLHDYCSDQTRTFWVGDTPSDDFLRTRDLVQKAQQAAIDKIRPGLPVAEAHRIAKAVFEDACAETHFTHSLGHGIGLETHEAPGVSLRVQTVLQKGMVITVEPGLYYPEWGGVRWEFMALVTEDGVELL